MDAAGTIPLRFFCVGQKSGICAGWSGIRTAGPGEVLCSGEHTFSDAIFSENAAAGMTGRDGGEVPRTAATTVPWTRRTTLRPALRHTLREACGAREP